MAKNQHYGNIPQGEDDYNPNSFQATLARMEAKIDQLVEYRLSHEQRITSLEKKAWYLTGLGAAGVFIGNFLFELIKKLKP